MNGQLLAASEYWLMMAFNTGLFKLKSFFERTNHSLKQKLISRVNLGRTVTCAGIKTHADPFFDSNASRTSCTEWQNTPIYTFFYKQSNNRPKISNLLNNY